MKTLLKILQIIESLLPVAWLIIVIIMVLSESAILAVLTGVFTAVVSCFMGLRIFLILKSDRICRPMLNSWESDFLIIAGILLIIFCSPDLSEILLVGSTIAVGLIDSATIYFYNSQRHKGYIS